MKLKVTKAMLKALKDEITKDEKLKDYQIKFEKLSQRAYTIIQKLY